MVEMNTELLNVINSWIGSAAIENPERVVNTHLLYQYIKEAKHIIENPTIASHDVSDANLALLLMIRRNQK